MFRYLVLGLLRDGQPQHGYAIMKGYEERTGAKMSSGNFYRELIRLTVDGLVRFVENNAGTDPRRSPYVITEEGAAAFDEWIANIEGVRVGPEPCDDVVGRAMFFGVADPSVVRGMLNHWTEELWYKIKTVERCRESALLGHDTSPFPVRSLLLARRLKHMAADLEFLNELSDAYEQWLTRTSGSSVRTDVRRSMVDGGRSPRQDDTAPPLHMAGKPPER